MTFVAAGVRPANPADAVISAEADQRMAKDAMQMATREWRSVQQQMMEQATDANWWSWQQRVEAAKRAADNATTRYVEASKAVARANVAAWSEAA